MSARLPMLCPSNFDPARPDGAKFFATPCTMCAPWWDKLAGECAAARDLAEQHTGARNLSPVKDAAMPPCGLATVCAWDLGARRRGEPGCTPRRLGMTCEHQGGEWQTWDVMGPEDECWRTYGDH